MAPPLKVLLPTLLFPYLCIRPDALDGRGADADLLAEIAVTAVARRAGEDFPALMIVDKDLELGWFTPPADKLLDLFACSNGEVERSFRGPIEVLAPDEVILFDDRYLIPSVVSASSSSSTLKETSSSYGESGGKTASTALSTAARGGE